MEALTNRILMKFVVDVYLWTRKSSLNLNFGRQPDLDIDLLWIVTGFAVVAVCTPQMLSFQCFIARVSMYCCF